jgi:hypothetical protein
MRFAVRVRPLDSLLGSLRGCLDRLPDKRRGINTTYGMADIGTAAFTVFFMQSPSFLAHQRQFEAGHGRSNCTSLFGIAKIPSDNHIRAMLDPAPPALLHPVFAEAVDQITRIDGGLDVFRRLDGHLPIALDGCKYHCSRKVHCPRCSTRLRGKGETEYFHSMLVATLVAPGHDKSLPREAGGHPVGAGAHRPAGRHSPASRSVRRCWTPTGTSSSSASRRPMAPQAAPPAGFGGTNPTRRNAPFGSPVFNPAPPGGPVDVR